MTTRILMILMALATTVAVSDIANAGELDNETYVTNEQAMRAKELPGTVVVRVDAKGEASVLETTDLLSQDAKTVKAIHTALYKKISASGTAELDRTSSTSSWFAWYNRSFYYAPTYYYSGYNFNFTNCFTYAYAGYNYFWYRW